jgi:hypothetical protein
MTYLVEHFEGFEEDVSTVQLSFDKVFEIDPSTGNLTRLRDRLAKFVAVATPVKAQPCSTSRRTSAAASSTRPAKKQLQLQVQGKPPAGWHQIRATKQFSGSNQG